MELKIPQNLVVVLIGVVFVIVLVNLNVVSFFGSGKTIVTGKQILWNL